MKQSKYDRKAYKLAKSYLLNLKEVTPRILKKYLRPCATTSKPDSINDIYKQLLESAQNANMKPSIIGNSINGIGSLKYILFNFNPKKVLKQYTSYEVILDSIIFNLMPTGEIRRTSQSIWPKYCQSILSAAKFISQFKTANEFYQWINNFYQDDRARPALPMLIANEIDGLGFALACDFLKELGYENFAKPDVHIKDIFIELKLCSAKANGYQIFKAILRVAKNSHVTPYNVDKIFWLIGSGNFYDDRQIGKNGRIGSHKKEFINYALLELNE